MFQNRFWRWGALGAVAAMSVTGCARVNLDEVTRGRFEGNVHLIWLRGGEGKPLGDGEFLYLPMPGDELVYHRGKGSWTSPGTERIEPQAFITDGGSVPRVVQGVPGLNAWAYGPAYIIHDWAFVARKCLNDEPRYLAAGLQSPVTAEMRNIENMSFEESAYLMAETIATVVALGDSNIDMSALIAPVTAGPRSHALWVEKGACEKSLVSQDIVDTLTPVARRLVVQPKAGGRREAYAPREVTLPDGRTAVFLGTLPDLVQ